MVALIGGFGIMLNKLRVVRDVVIFVVVCTIAYVFDAKDKQLAEQREIVQQLKTELDKCR